MAAAIVDFDLATQRISNSIEEINNIIQYINKYTAYIIGIKAAQSKALI